MHIACYLALAVAYIVASIAYGFLLWSALSEGAHAGVPAAVQEVATHTSPAVENHGAAGTGAHGADPPN